MGERPHVLIVRDAGEPYTGPLSNHEWADWDVEHFDDCPTEKLFEHDGAPCFAYRCGVGAHLDELGCRWSLRYSGTPVDAPGRYLIEPWHEVMRGFDWTEHDAGLRLSDEQPNPAEFWRQWGAYAFRTAPDA
jgi:hypothetical protein